MPRKTFDHTKSPLMLPASKVGLQKKVEWKAEDHLDPELYGLLSSAIRSKLSEPTPEKRAKQQQSLYHQAFLTIQNELEHFNWDLAIKVLRGFLIRCQTKA